MKSMKLGGGGRFAAMVKDLMGQGMSSDSARKIAAHAGMAKYGKAKMAKMAAAGRRRSQ